MLTAQLFFAEKNNPKLAAQLIKFISGAKFIVPFSFSVLLIVIFWKQISVNTLNTEKVDWGGDQAAILITMEKVVQGQAAQGLQRGWLPAGFAASVNLTHKIFKFFSPQIPLKRTLIWHGILSFWLASLVLFFFNRKLLRRELLNWPPIKNGFVSEIVLSAVPFLFQLFIFRYCLAAQFYFIPWTHYFPAFIVMLLLWQLCKVFDFDGLSKPYWSHFVFVGILLGLLLQSRVHEFIAFVFSVVVFLVLALPGSNSARSKAWLFKTLGWIGVGVVVVFGIIALLIFPNFLHLHYLKNSQTSPLIIEYFKFYPQLVPIRIIQVFLDPNFYGFHQSEKIFDVTKDLSLSYFDGPLLMQLPAFFYFFIGIFFAAVAFLVKRMRVFQKLLFIIPTVFLGSLVFGYFATANGGSIHLKNGFVREFISPMFLLTAGFGPWFILSSTRSWSKSTRTTWVWTGLSLLIPFLLVAVIFHPLVQRYGLPKFKSFHIQTAQVTHKCSDQRCSGLFSFLGVNNKEMSLPFDKFLIYGYCHSKRQEFAQTFSGSKFDFEIMPCPKPYVLMVMPIISGHIGSTEYVDSWQIGEGKVEDPLFVPGFE